MVDTQAELKAHLRSSDGFFPRPLWPLLPLLDGKSRWGRCLIRCFSLWWPGAGLGHCSLSFAEARRKPWHLTERSFGCFASACLKQQYLIGATLTETFSSVGLVFLLHTIHSLQRIYFSTFYMQPLFLLFVVHYTLATLSNIIETLPCSLSPENVTHTILP